MSFIKRRHFLTQCGAALAGGITLPNLFPAEAGNQVTKSVAAIVTAFPRNSHADVIVGRILTGYDLDGAGPYPALKVASLYLDQVPENDQGRRLAADHGVRLCRTIEEALTLGRRDLAVEGVLLIGEHGKYPTSETGQIMYPRRRFFEETVAVFRRCGRSVPVFSDKHLAWNWTDAKWMYDTARELNIPFMAGSSLPVTWRRPPIDLQRGSRLAEVVGIAYGPLDAYGFHALEMLQCLCERRHGGETGVAAVQCLTGPAVWQARAEGRFNAQLFTAALARLKKPDRFKGDLAAAVGNPVVFVIEFRDGLRAAILMLNPAVREWAVAWCEADRSAPQSTQFWLEGKRPYGHFKHLLKGVERMIHTAKPTWPVERTLLTTGMLHELHVSKMRGGVRLETPHLAIAYQPTYDWQPPVPPRE